MRGQHTQGRIEIGQVWRDNNPRSKGRKRAVVGIKDGKVVMCALSETDMRLWRVLISSFGTGNQIGWSLVEGEYYKPPNMRFDEVPVKGGTWGDRSTPILYEAIRRGMRLSQDGKVILQSGRIVGEGKPCKEGYRLLGLSVDGQRCTVSVARVVCLLAHGEPPSPNHVADHIDGNKLNDHPSNLRWATRSENVRNSHHTRKNATLPTYSDVVAELAAARALLQEALDGIRSDHEGRNGKDYSGGLIGRIRSFLEGK